tara:strand:+ start:581 stop:814 length:234 start_codon:yes stop_codon:yes gene_type:complete
MDSPLAKHVPVANIKTKTTNLVAKHVLLENTMISKDNQFAKHVVLGNTMLNKDKLPNLAAKMTAMLVPTLNPINPRV